MSSSGGVLLSTLFLSNVSMTNTTLSDHHFDYLLGILDHYPSFSFIIHTDDTYIDVAEHLTQILTEERGKFVAVYDCNSNTYPDIKRPYGIKFINVVLTRDPWIFETFLLKYRNVILYDNIVFVLRSSDAWDVTRNGRFWEMSFIKLAGNIIILDMSVEGETTVYSKCYYCGHQGDDLRLLEVTNETRNEISYNHLRPGTFDKFNGHRFIVAFTDFIPYMHCSKSVEGNIDNENFLICVEYSGPEARMVEMLSWRLNFTFTFVSDPFNASFAKVMDNLVERKVDFAIGGISVTYKRFLEATFTTHLRFEDMVLLYFCRDSAIQHLGIFVVPFGGQVWVVVLGTLVTIAFCINRFLTIGTTRISFLQSLTICGRSFMEQGVATSQTKILSTRGSAFFIFTALMVACIEINTAYRSKLASIYARPPHYEPESAEELISLGYEIGIESYEFYAELISETDPVLQKIRSQKKNYGELCEQLYYAQNEKVALMNEISALNYLMRFVCISHNNTAIPEDKARITRQPLRSNPHAWVLQPAVPFWKAFDVQIGKLKNGGFLDKWTRDTLTRMGVMYRPFPRTNTFDEERSANLAAFGSIFLVYIFGNLIGILAFAGELFAKRSSKKRTIIIDRYKKAARANVFRTSSERV